MLEESFRKFALSHRPPEANLFNESARGTRQDKDGAEYMGLSEKTEDKEAVPKESEIKYKIARIKEIREKIEDPKGGWREVASDEEVSYVKWYISYIERFYNEGVGEEIIVDDGVEFIDKYLQKHDKVTKMETDLKVAKDLYDKGYGSAKVRKELEKVFAPEVWGQEISPEGRKIIMEYVPKIVKKEFKKAAKKETAQKEEKIEMEALMEEKFLQKAEKFKEEADQLLYFAAENPPYGKHRLTQELKSARNNLANIRKLLDIINKEGVVSEESNLEGLTGVVGFTRKDVIPFINKEINTVQMYPEKLIIEYPTLGQIDMRAVAKEKYEKTAVDRQAQEMTRKSEILQGESMERLYNQISSMVKTAKELVGPANDLLQEEIVARLKIKQNEIDAVRKALDDFNAYDIKWESAKQLASMQNYQYCVNQMPEFGESITAIYDFVKKYGKKEISKTEFKQLMEEGVALREQFEKQEKGTDRRYEREIKEEAKRAKPQSKPEELKAFEVSFLGEDFEETIPVKKEKKAEGKVEVSPDLYMDKLNSYNPSIMEYMGGPDKVKEMIIPLVEKNESEKLGQMFRGLDKLNSILSLAKDKKKVRVSYNGIDYIFEGVAEEKGGNYKMVMNEEKKGFFSKLLSFKKNVAIFTRNNPFINNLALINNVEEAKPAKKKAA